VTASPFSVLRYGLRASRQHKASLTRLAADFASLAAEATVRPVMPTMKVIGFPAAVLLLLTVSCRPHAHPRPAAVPGEAALIASLEPPTTAVWVSCAPVPDALRTFTCAFFDHPSGRRRSTGTFRLVQGDASGNPLPPPPAAPKRTASPTPAVPPSVLQLRSFDGWILRAQPPWFLLPQGTAPFITDPPPTAIPDTPRPA
jgi:hypothetical protein